MLCFHDPVTTVLNSLKLIIFQQGTSAIFPSHRWNCIQNVRVEVGNWLLYSLGFLRPTGTCPSDLHARHSRIRASHAHVVRELRLKSDQLLTSKPWSLLATLVVMLLITRETGHVTTVRHRVDSRRNFRDVNCHRCDKHQTLCGHGSGKMCSYYDKRLERAHILSVSDGHPGIPEIP